MAMCLFYYFLRLKFLTTKFLTGDAVCSSTPRLPPTVLVVHSCERTTAIGNRKVCCSCFFRWSMVMACSSLHRRDDTLDLVQCPKTRQDYTCIYHYIIEEICLLVRTSISHQLYKHTSYVAISVKSKHVPLVLKTKLLNTRYEVL